MRSGLLLILGVMFAVVVVASPADAAETLTATFDSDWPIDLTESVSFQDLYTEWAAEAAPPSVETAILDVDPLPVEFDPISLVADVVMSLLSLETAEIDDSETTPDEANMSEMVDSDIERANVEFSIATTATEPAMSSTDVQLAIDALLVEAEYLAELLFAIHDDLEPDYAFELTREIDSIIAEQLSDVAALDELRCDLLEREMAVEPPSPH